MTDLILDRFYSKLAESPSGCILWTGGTTGVGYGSFFIKTKFGRRDIGAHIFAWILENKKQPYGKIHHICENTRCCNPAHLKDLTESEHRLAHSKGIKPRKKYISFTVNGRKINVAR